MAMSQGNRAASTWLANSELTRRSWLAATSGVCWGGGLAGWLNRLSRGGQPADTAHTLVRLAVDERRFESDRHVRRSSRGMRTAVRLSPSPPARRAFRSSEHLPGLAQWSDRLAVIRFMSTRRGDHTTCFRDNLRTGYLPQGPIEFPVLGSLVSKECNRPPRRLAETTSAFCRRGCLAPGAGLSRLPRSRLCPALGGARERRHGRRRPTRRGESLAAGGVFRRRKPAAPARTFASCRRGILETAGADFGCERASQCVRQGLALDESGRSQERSTRPMSPPRFRTNTAARSSARAA